MATSSVDEPLIVNDQAPLTFTGAHPGVGTPQAVYAQDYQAGPKLPTYHEIYGGPDWRGEVVVGHRYSNRQPSLTR